MKRIFALVVAFVLLAGVAPVQAQVGVLGGGYWPSSWEGWMYRFEGDRVHMLQADQVEYVRRTLGIGQRAGLRRVTDDIAQSGPYVGLQGPKGFYPMYQCSKWQRIRRGVGTALLAGGAGYIVGHTTGYGEREGVLTGLGIGTGLALYLDANKCSSVQNKMVIIDDPSDVVEEEAPQAPPTRPRGISNRENGWNEILRTAQQEQDNGASWFRSSQNCVDFGMFTLKNETGEVIRVYQNGHPYAVLKPLGVTCGDPFAEYDAQMVVANSDNFTARAGTPRAKPEGRSGGLWIWR